jgi:hypothetical protein
VIKGGILMTNKFRISSILLLSVSILLTVIMLVDTAITYNNYLQHPEWSAPFSVFFLSNIITYGIPVLLGLALSLIFKIKANKTLS